MVWQLQPKNRKTFQYNSSLNFLWVSEDGSAGPFARRFMDSRVQNPALGLPCATCASRRVQVLRSEGVATEKKTVPKKIEVAEANLLSTNNRANTFCGPCREHVCSRPCCEAFAALRFPFAQQLAEQQLYTTSCMLIVFPRFCARPVPFGLCPKTSTPHTGTTHNVAQLARSSDCSSKFPALFHQTA